MEYVYGQISNHWDSVVQVQEFIYYLMPRIPRLSEVKDNPVRKTVFRFNVDGDLCAETNGRVHRCQLHRRVLLTTEEGIRDQDVCAKIKINILSS